jgi:hypothetical protein
MFFFPFKRRPKNTRFLSVQNVSQFFVRTSVKCSIEKAMSALIVENGFEMGI